MKRVIAMVLATMLMLSLTACGGSGNTSSSSAAEASQSTADSKASNSAGEEVEAEYVLSLGDVLAETHPHSQSYTWFADRVKELTGGKVQVNVFVNSTLGNQADLVEGLSLGTVQIAKSMTTGLSVYCPEIQIFDLPYMFQSTDQFFKVVDGEIGEYFANDVLGEEDLVGIAYFYAGARSIYSAEPVESMKDLAGKKLRVPQSPIFMSLCDSFGASGSPMSVGELYTALQTGVVDGAENAPIFYYQQKHYEAAPYLTMTQHIMTPDIVVMSKSYLESLPQEYQDAIRQAGKEMMQYERDLWFSQEEAAMKELEAAGVTFIEVDKAPFIEAAQTVWKDYADIVGQNMIDKIQELA
ncbi:MAG: TRAP transporter substrate-binding protein [Candidatus Fimivivens sp.]